MDREHEAEAQRDRETQEIIELLTKIEGHFDRLLSRQDPGSQELQPRLVIDLKEMEK